MIPIFTLGKGENIEQMPNMLHLDIMMVLADAVDDNDIIKVSGHMFSIYLCSITCLIGIQHIHSEASLIRTPLIRIIYLSGHMFGNQL